ncbi:unnamed protein product [Rotaria sp. Silwood2]|nr:unnamed protein product [Rotaria sp. Silwood2]CAF4090943.1 unnamed protein product [Rotaria sp. Silwood2]
MDDIYLRPMMEVLQSNRFQVSIIFDMLPAITLGSEPIVTILVNRYGCRRIMIIDACLAAFGFLASSFYANIWLYYIAIGIVGGNVQVCFYLLFDMDTYTTSTSLKKIRESTLVASSKQQLSSTNNECHISLLDVKQNISTNQFDENNEHDEILFESLEKESPVLLAHKDTIYQGDLHHIRLLYEKIDEYHRQIIMTSDMKTVQSTASTGEKTIMTSKKSFIHELSNEIDLMLFQDNAYILFSIDANITEHHQHWIIMSIGIGNYVVHVILGYSCGIILFAIPILKQRQEHHQGLTKHQRDMVVVSYSKQISTADE